MTFGFRSGRLPAEVTSFVGRTAELASVRRLLGRSRLVTLTGPGGVGKTRIALRAASQVKGDYADGVRLVQLSGLRDAELLPHTVAGALGLAGNDPRPALDALLEALADREHLLVLDTCEHLLDAVALLADVLLPTAPRLHILATSRQPLDVPGEHLYAVQPLSVPDPGESGHRPGSASSDALALFTQRAAAAAPGFEITDGNREQALTLIRRLDGIPLGIELAAVRLRALTLDQLAQHLSDAYDVLEAGRSVPEPRHRTLRTLIGWSHELCTPQERLLWARLSVFAGGFDLAAAEAVCADAELPVANVLPLLISLVDKSVVLRADGPGGPRDEARYRLLDTIREYGADWLDSLGETTACRARHVAHYHRLLSHFADRFFTSEQLRLARALAPDGDNLRAALGYALQDPDTAGSPLSLTAVMWSYWATEARIGEADYWMAKALARASEPAAHRATTLIWRADFGRYQGRQAQCLPWVLEACKTADELGDPRLVAQALRISAGVHNWLGDESSAMAALTAAEPLLAAHGARADLIQHHYIKGSALLFCTRRPDLAMVELDAALRLCTEEPEECWAQGYASLLRTMALVLLGRPAEAVAEARRCAALKGALGDTVGIAGAVEMAGWAEAGQGRHRRASRLIGAAAAQWRRLGSEPVSGQQAALAMRERTIGQIQEAIGEKEFTRLFTEGETLGQDQALAFTAAGTDAPQALPRRRAAGTPAAAPATGTPVDALTRRELEVAELVAQGLSNREISQRLVISKRTADAHVEHILSKLGFSSRLEIAALLGSADEESAEDTHT
ncbi:LuxR family transcriptional regulator [Streptomyces sp. A7024]|uniref:LuxR family transcriptional regulator n=1 Tax=Streptomyces coryli TaxID=1128680 RepID=A0A6G4UAU2_9ACTN|nr:LuxR C-terminal-related transcriptional regulator [Streptomyces coryli]NGN68311.1 LuxR family transcriptional regulator [Streptomyces coryli]